MAARVYRIAFASRAERDFRALASEVQHRLKPRIDSLARNPYPRGVKFLSEGEGLLRLRVGNCRIIYQVQREILRILVLKIGHRRDVYRKP